MYMYTHTHSHTHTHTHTHTLTHIHTHTCIHVHTHTHTHTHTHAHTRTHTQTQWSLRLDPNDRPTCSQLLRHELFTKAGWSDKFTADLRAKIEKELEENPLLKNLGVTIYGSVYEAKRSKSDLHKKVHVYGVYLYA